MGVGARTRGLSLLETIIAMFLFTAGAALVAGLFHTALRYSSRVEDRVLAAMVAEKSLQEVREWAASPSGGVLNYNGSWSYYDGTVRPDPDHPKFVVQYEVEDHQLTSPSSSFEQLIPAGERVTVPVKRVRATVRWDTSELSLSTLLEEPPRRFRATNPLILTGAIPSKVKFGDTINFSVKAYAQDNLEIEGLEYEWWVESLSTYATATYTGNGETAVFEAEKTLDDGTVLASPKGECRMVVRAVYRGEERSIQSGIILVDF